LPEPQQPKESDQQASEDSEQSEEEHESQYEQDEEEEEVKALCQTSLSYRHFFNPDIMLSSTVFPIVRLQFTS
jgi:hypothetical protein